jgi:aspartate/methionine/tyrosine aminotransferase
MFSNRVHWDLRPNRVTELLRSRRGAGARIFDLTQSNPTAAGFAYPAEEILASLSDQRSLLYEPSPAGLAQTRAAIAQAHGVEPNRIFVTASTSESYAYLFKILGDPGDEVLVPRPSYPLFEFLATLESLEVRQYPLVYHEGWYIDFKSLASSVTPKTRAIVLVNPNNPTGSFLKREELARLIDLCSRRDLAIISDEVFSDYRFGTETSLVPTLAGVAEVPVFALSGFSKLLGLPQMKLGWMVLGEHRFEESFERLELVADTFLSVGTPIQHAAPRLLAMRPKLQESIRGRLRRNLDVLRTSAAGSHCSVLDVEGGWYATLAVPRTRTEEEWVLALLEQDDVLVQPGFFFDFDAEAFLVLSLLTEESEFREGVDRLLARTARS